MPTLTIEYNNTAKHTAANAIFDFTLDNGGAIDATLVNGGIDFT